MRAELLQLATLCAAFWTAVRLYRGDRPGRFVAGLALGAAFAHLGWALLHLPAVLQHPWALVDLSRGFSVLFVPLGLLLLAPTAAALGTLPLALAVARLGCLTAGCCQGPDGEVTPLAEIAGLLLLHAGLRRVPERWVVPCVLAGLGLLRLATEPWRAAPPLGAPLVAPAVLATAWVGAGVLALLLLTAAPAVAADAVPGSHAVPADAVVDVVPFEEQGETNRVYVDLAQPGRRPFVWLLDTGAQGNVMTPLAARAAGVSVRRAKSTPYVRKTRLGSSVRFWVDTRSSDTGSRTGWEYGLLGGEFLEEYVVEIDFPQRRVRFLDPKRYRVPESAEGSDAQVIPMRVRGKRPFVEVDIDGRSIPVLLDTGMPNNIVLSGKAAAKLGIDWRQLPDFGRFGSTVGPVEVRLHETDGFRFAGFDYATMPVVVAPRGWYNMGGNTDSALGFDTLRRFVVRLDYPRQRLWLQATGDPTITYLGVDYELTRRVGVYMNSTTDGYVVLGVSPDGAAARIGLRPGDVPVNPAGEGPLDLADFLSRVEAQQEVSVARRQGKVWVDTILPEAQYTEPQQ